MDDVLSKRLDNIEQMLKMIVHGTQNGEMPGEIIDIKEAARICGLNVKTLYNYVNQGKFYYPWKRKGKKLEFKRSDVLKWDAERIKYS